MSLGRSLSVLFAVSAVIQHISGQSLVNYTIDDTNGDQLTKQPPTYTGTWSQDGIFSGPESPLLPLSPFDNTWTVGKTFGFDNSTASMTLTFNGTAIYVFGILDAETSIAPTNVSIILDGKPTATYQATPPTGIPSNVNENNVDPYQYNVSIYSNPSLEYKPHNVTLVVEPDQLGSGGESILVFDYAIYTANNVGGTSGSGGTTSPSSSSTPVGPIAGGSAAGLIFTFISFFFCYRWCCRPRYVAAGVLQNVNVQNNIAPAPAAAPVILPMQYYPSGPRGYGDEELGYDRRRPSRAISANSSVAVKETDTEMLAEMETLRSEVARLRSTASSNTAPGRARGNPTQNNDAVAREMANMRAEMEALRAGQQTLAAGGVPPPAYHNSF